MKKRFDPDDRKTFLISGGVERVPMSTKRNLLIQRLDIIWMGSDGSDLCLSQYDGVGN